MLFAMYFVSFVQCKSQLKSVQIVSELYVNCVYVLLTCECSYVLCEYES